MTKIVVLSRRSILHPLTGGAGRYVHEIFRRLSDRYDVTVLAEGKKTDPSIVELDNITYVNLRGPLVRIRVLLRYLARHLRSSDILVDHADVAIPWLSPILPIRRRITIVHQLLREIYYYELHHPWADLGFFAEPYLYRLYSGSRIVASQTSTAEELMALGILGKYICVIKPACNNIAHQVLPLEKRDNAIVCVTRLMRYKGLQYAIVAFREVLKNSPNTKLRIAGSGRYGGELLDKVKQLGIEDNVEFLGRVSEKEKFGLLSKSRAALFPSVRDGYGISVIEANSVGTPVVGWDVPGPKDSIKDNVTGLLATFPDETAFAKCLQTLLIDDSTWSRFSDNALKWANDHSWDRSADEFGRLIEDVLSGDL